ncbi:hypothetical protein [Pedobacter sp. Hv1]|uniref:hypothetical protein n=1 Tax=Pedobacter sp. Hv1 TaxID=1740090 RepID=UPI0006D8962A|nr:hypothetical protein [Pedobacter sp. Hv1]KQC00871.1 hypothetical protein AQF98_09345 [Pedobacter sp. Hv1]
MKKIALICFAILVFGGTSVNAQGVLDKIENILNKADRATNTADKAAKTGQKATNLLAKKKGTEAEVAETKTTLKLTGVNFAALKELNEKLLIAKGVESTKMKFSATGSTILLQHVGSTEDLLKILQKTNPTIFADKNIDGMDDGEISVKVKL